GLDFFNNYKASRHWLAGGDAYRDSIGDPLSRTFCYPPLVLPTFAWCAWFTSQRALHIFMLALTSITGFSVWSACRARRELNSEPLPYVLLLAAVLFSTPLLYALERGNYDLLVLPPLLIAAWCLRERSWLRDGLAGLCLAYATGIKIYPGLLIVSLLPLRRPRAVAFCGLAGLALLLFHPGDYAAFRANAAALVAENDLRITQFFSWSMHSLTATWPLLVEPLGLKPLVRLPGGLAAALILGPIIGWVSWQIYRCTEPRRLILPYFLWLTAAATYLPPVANDYSLVFLPLAVVALWDRRDPLLVHLVMGLLLLWWQPWQLDIGPRVLMVGKVAGLWAMGISLINRVCEQNQRVELTDMSQTIVSLPRAA
ncbi:MAG TPA: glycosyltransferase family 87 protein, partial [Gemmataceae bacterium]|nr:glycosyltransferase family 87 protein [Gemmataceae bacterium]